MEEGSDVAEKSGPWSSGHLRTKIELVVTSVFLFIFARLHPTLATIPFTGISLNDSEIPHGLLLAALSSMWIFFFSAFCLRTTIEGGEQAQFNDFIEHTNMMVAKIHDDIRRLSSSEQMVSLQKVAADVAQLLQSNKDWATAESARSESEGALVAELQERQNELTSLVSAATQKIAEGEKDFSDGFYKMPNHLRQAVEHLQGIAAQRSAIVHQLTLLEKAASEEVAARQLALIDGIAGIKSTIKHLETAWEDAKRTHRSVRSVIGTERMIVSVYIPLYNWCKMSDSRIAWIFTWQ